MPERERPLSTRIRGVGADVGGDATLALSFAMPLNTRDSGQKIRMGGS